ncbi:hypothetical protein ACS0TY_026543 [Phlomoides rotata]
MRPSSWMRDPCSYDSRGQSSLERASSFVEISISEVLPLPDPSSLFSIHTDLDGSSLSQAINLNNLGESPGWAVSGFLKLNQSPLKFKYLPSLLCLASANGGGFRKTLKGVVEGDGIIIVDHGSRCEESNLMPRSLSQNDMLLLLTIKRVALSTAANMCKRLPSDATDFMMEVVPLLTNLIQYHDAKVLESASICLTRIAEAFASSPEKLDELCNHGLVTQAATLISSSNSGGGQASLGTSTYTGLIRLLSTCASGSPLGVKSLLLLGISGILKDILSGSGFGSSISVSPALSKPLSSLAFAFKYTFLGNLSLFISPTLLTVFPCIFEVVNLANELLPPLPQGTNSLPASSSFFMKVSVPKKGNTSNSGKLDESNGNVQEASTREKLLNDQPELLQQFGMDLFPILVQKTFLMRQSGLETLSHLHYVRGEVLVKGFWGRDSVRGEGRRPMRLVEAAHRGGDRIAALGWFDLMRSERKTALMGK